MTGCEYIKAMMQMNTEVLNLRPKDELILDEELMRMRGRNEKKSL